MISLKNSRKHFKKINISLLQISKRKKNWSGRNKSKFILGTQTYPDNKARKRHYKETTPIPLMNIGEKKKSSAKY